MGRRRSRMPGSCNRDGSWEGNVLWRALQSCLPTKARGQVSVPHIGHSLNAVAPKRWPNLKQGNYLCQGNSQGQTVLRACSRQHWRTGVSVPHRGSEWRTTAPANHVRCLERYSTCGQHSNVRSWVYIIAIHGLLDSRKK